MVNKVRSLIRMIKVYVFKYILERSPAKAMLERDIQGYVQMHNRSMAGTPLFEKLAWLLLAENLEEFHNLFYYRVGTPAKFLERQLLALMKVMYKPRDTIYISTTSIGPGFVLMHGLGNVIDAEKIGENCLVFQEVVIGCKNEVNDRPTIGNFVHLSVGSKILGKITIGDHVVVAANTVVTKDLPPNSLAIGIPARIIQNAGNKAEYIANGIISA